MVRQFRDLRLEPLQLRIVFADRHDLFPRVLEVERTGMRPLQEPGALITQPDRQLERVLADDTNRRTLHQRRHAVVRRGRDKDVLLDWIAGIDADHPARLSKAPDDLATAEDADDVHRQILVLAEDVEEVEDLGGLHGSVPLLGHIQDVPGVTPNEGLPVGNLAGVMLAAEANRHLEYFPVEAKRFGLLDERAILSLMSHFFESGQVLRRRRGRGHCCFSRHDVFLLILVRGVE